ncbi:MAG: hypothetical protein ACRDVP_05535 [Acidimicrobiales bacterium]
MESKIDMAARRQVTNKRRSQCRRASKEDKGEIVDATTGMGRSTAPRMLRGPVLVDPAHRVDRRRLRPLGYSSDSRALLDHMGALMGMPCGKYLVVMCEVWAATSTVPSRPRRDWQN